MDILVSKITANAVSEAIMNFYMMLAHRLIDSCAEAKISREVWGRIVRVSECAPFALFVLQKQPELLHVTDEKIGNSALLTADPAVRQTIQDFEVEGTAAKKAVDGVCYMCDACVLS